jgi:hypothetical protein
MMRWLALALVVGLVLGGAAACRRVGDDLTAVKAAEALRTDSGFTTRERSLVGRRLEEVLAVRRIGASSTEVEFTWRDFPLPPGEKGPLKTSMALFRKDDDGRWELAAFFKVD